MCLNVFLYINCTIEAKCESIHFAVCDVKDRTKKKDCISYLHYKVGMFSDVLVPVLLMSLYTLGLQIIKVTERKFFFFLIFFGGGAFPLY